MTERQLYEAHREAVARYTGEHLPPWQFLAWTERQVWERHAAEQHARDAAIEAKCQELASR